MNLQIENNDKDKEAVTADVDHISEIQQLVKEAIEKEKETYEVEGNLQHDLDSIEVLTALNNGEDGDACLYMYLNKGKLVYDHKACTWFRWKNDRWTPDCVDQCLVSFDSVIDTYANEVTSQNNMQIEAVKQQDKEAEGKAGKTQKALLDRIKKLRQLNRRRNILKLASSGDDSLGISGDEWDTQIEVLPCENGVYDLKTGEFREHVPEDYIKTVAPVEFLGREVAAPVFEEFLSTSLNHNKELIVFVQRLLGSALSGSVIEHRISIFWGEKGRNGKGTLFEILKIVLGPLCVPIQAEMLLRQKNSKSSSSASPDILHLKGKRIVWASEIEEGRHLNVSLLKLLSGGDTLTARGVFEKTYTEFISTHSVFMITNHRPHIPTNENAMWERVFLIPFELSFVDDPKEPHQRKRDPHLKEKLLKEKSGILAWLLRGYHDYQRKGLNPPEIVLQQVDQYKNDEDTIHGFIQECCEINKDKIANSTDLYKAYREYCENNDLKQESHKKFGSMLLNKFRRVRPKGISHYEGISLQLRY